MRKPMHQAGRARRTRGRVVVAMMAAGLLWLPAAAQVTTQAPLGPVGVNTSPAAQRATGVAVELHGDEPLAQYLILRFMEGHPDLAWRIRGREAYARGDYETALCYLQQSLAIQQEIGDKSGVGSTLNNISQIFYRKDRAVVL